MSLNEASADGWLATRLLSLQETFGARATAHSRWAAYGYEFLIFGIKQGWACLFGGMMLALLIGTYLWYPRDAVFARYDFLVVASVIIQIGLLYFRLETWGEAKVIFLFHLVGTGMEIFKTAAGSWIYPEPSILRFGGVPLFTGFMYAAVGSYIARIWRIFDFRFTRYPPVWMTVALSVGIYINFFWHHYFFDLRYLIFALTALMFGRTWIYFCVWKIHRRMPMLLGFALVALFIWFAENIATFSSAWLYPNQMRSWSMVSIAKFGSWFLLMIISFVMVSMVQRLRPYSGT